MGINRPYIRRSRKPQTPAVSRLAAVRDGLAIVAIVIGGAWAGVEFGYDRWIAPLLEPSLVRVEASSKIVGRSRCCVLIELESKLTNVGKRATTIHSSQLAIGAKPLAEVPPTLPPKVVEQFNYRLRVQHEDAQLSSPNPLLELQQGPTSPSGEHFLVLAIGSLVEPGYRLVPGESVVRSMAVTVPDGFPFLTMRAKALVSHLMDGEPDVVWHWSVGAEKMDLGWIAWRANEAEALRLLALCVRRQADAEAEICRRELVTLSRGVESSFFARDPHSYVIHFALDMFAWKPTVETALKE